MKIDAMLTAGGIPEENDPLFEFTQGQSKALLDVAGKPMAQWILDALDESKQVGNIVVVDNELAIKGARLACDIG